MHKIPILNNDDWDKTMLSKRCELYSMYSSLTSSITKDISKMMIPIDDHLVHRGDGYLNLSNVLKVQFII